MLRRVVIGVAMACLMSGAAYAQDETEAPASPCTDRLDSVADIVADKVNSGALSDDDAQKANEMLDTAQGQCTDGDSAAAFKTLDSVLAMTGKAK